MAEDIEEAQDREDELARVDDVMEEEQNPEPEPQPEPELADIELPEVEDNNQEGGGNLLEEDIQEQIEAFETEKQLLLERKEIFQNEMEGLQEDTANYNEEYARIEDEINGIDSEIEHINGQILERTPVEFELSDKWWDDLENTPLSSEGCIYELVDNSLAHAPSLLNGERKKLVVEINLYELSEENPSSARMIEIIDNSSGIGREDLARALSMWGNAGRYDANGDNKISEHGCGMKYAMRCLGRDVKIITKKSSMDQAMVITTENILSMVSGGFFPEYIDVDWEEGTCIEITDLTAKGQYLANTQGVNRLHQDLLFGLGQRYQRVIGSRFEDGGFRVNRKCWNGEETRNLVKALRPVVYDHRENEPNVWMVPTTTITDPVRNLWEVDVKIGKCPTSDDNWSDFEDDVATQRQHFLDPYRSTAKKYGFDLIRRDLVIETNYFAGNGGIVNEDNNDYLPLRGQIILKRGFKSGTQKVSISRDSNFLEMKEEVRRILYGERADSSGRQENFMNKHIRGPNSKNKSEQELEAALCDYWSKPNSIALTGFPKFNRDDIVRQVWDKSGRVDILINSTTPNRETVCVEVKKTHGKGLDVYQLLMYMNENNTRHGILAARKFSAGAKIAKFNISKFVKMNGLKNLIKMKRKINIFFYCLETNTHEIPSDLDKWNSQMRVFADDDPDAKILDNSEL